MNSFAKLFAAWRDEPKTDGKKEPHIVKMFIGGFTGMVTATTVHPLDVLKVRLQISRSNWRNRDMARLIIQREGFRGLYAGLSAALLRQATVTTTRFGVFNVMYTNYIAKHGKKPNIREKISIGVLAGIISSFIGAPCEVALIRMLTESTYRYEIMERHGVKQPQKYHYSGVFQTLRNIIVEEGHKAIFKGATLTVARSIILSVSQIGTYSKVDDFLTYHRMRSPLNQHICCGVLSSLVAAVFSLPVDIVKTRYLMKHKYFQKPKTIFKNIIKKEGVRSLYKGFIPYYMRMLYTTITSVLLVNKITVLYHTWKLPSR